MAAVGTACAAHGSGASCGNAGRLVESRRPPQMGREHRCMPSGTSASSLIFVSRRQASWSLEPRPSGDRNGSESLQRTCPHPGAGRWQAAHALQVGYGSGTDRLECPDRSLADFGLRVSQQRDQPVDEPLCCLAADLEGEESVAPDARVFMIQQWFVGPRILHLQPAQCPPGSSRDLRRVRRCGRVCQGLESGLPDRTARPPRPSTRRATARRRARPALPRRQRPPVPRAHHAPPECAPRNPRGNGQQSHVHGRHPNQVR